MRLASLVRGLGLPESPRWHQGRLWFSDMNHRRVCVIDENGILSTVVDVPHRPSGLGWLPDGRLMVVSMLDHRLMVLDEGRLQEVVDLSDLGVGPSNDMIVDELGRAYVGSFGFENSWGSTDHPTRLALIEPNGAARVVAWDLYCPNGMAITPDGGTLIVAETHAHRLTAFDRLSNGELSNRRVWADLGEPFPDGISLDVEGAVWVADSRHNQVIRVAEGGKVLQRISTGTRDVFACTLGGADLTTLYLCTNSGVIFENDTQIQGRIEYCQVDVPAA